MGSPLEDTPLSAAEASARDGLAHWRVQGNRLLATFRVASMPLGAQLVQRIVAAAEELNHHPDLDLRFRALHVSVTTHSRGGLTEADAVLAEEISRIATELECPPRPAPVLMEFTVPAADPGSVAPFWQALLGYREAPASEGRVLLDRAGRMPDLRFRTAPEDATGESAARLDIHLPADVAAQRVSDARAAGGEVVDDEHAPRFWQLADPQGTQLRVCTWRAAGEEPTPGG